MEITASATQDIKLPEYLRLILISDDPDVARLVHESCPSPHEVKRFSLAAVFGVRGIVTSQLETILSETPTAHAVLIEWGLAQAPLVGIVGYHVRMVPPPLIAVCRNGQEEQATALVIGADDTWTLPFSLSLLRAKIVAHLRSLQYSEINFEVPASPDIEPVSHRFHRAGELTIDRKAHRFLIGDTEIELTPRLFELVGYLMHHVGELVTREQVLDDLWGIDYEVTTNTVDVYVHMMRRVLDASQVRASIETIRGKGYRFIVNET